MSSYSVEVGIVLWLIGILSLDFALAVDEIKGNTYSEILRGWFHQMSWLYYLVAFTVGALMAHWGPV